MDEQRPDNRGGRDLGSELGNRIHNHIHDRIHDGLRGPLGGRRYGGRMRSGAGGVIMGGLIVALGLGLLLDNMGIIRARDFWRYWPVFIIFFGVAKIVERWRPASILFGGGVAILGVLLLLDNLNFIVLDFNLVWPMAIILAGGVMLWNALGGARLSPVCEGGTPVTVKSDTNMIAIFSGQKRRIESEFRGCEIIAIFGGVQLDLRRASIPDGQPAVIDVSAVFGGVEIEAPEECRVTMRGVPIFGGFEDKTRAPRIAEGVTPPELIVSGSAVFGGVTIR